MEFSLNLRRERSCSSSSPFSPSSLLRNVRLQTKHREAHSPPPPPPPAGRLAASPAPRCFSEAPAMTPPVAEPWTTVRYSTKPTKSHLTIVIKLTEVGRLKSLSELQSAHLTDAVTAAARLTPSEAKETYFKIRDVQNVLIADTYRPSAQEKLVQTTKLTIANRDYAVTSYPSAPTNSCKGVIHGVASLTTPDELIANIESNVPVLTARTMGKTETALITFEGTYVHYTIYYRRLQFRCHPHKPKSQQCQNCLQLGHRAEVCPKKGKLTVCDICYQENMTSDTLHNCVPYCVNCKEEHASKDPNCPAKKQADAQATLAAYKRRVQQRPNNHPQHTPHPSSTTKTEGWESLGHTQPAPPTNTSFRQGAHCQLQTGELSSTAHPTRVNSATSQDPQSQPQQQDRKPDVILLRDTQGTHNLPQYTPYTQPSITQTDRRQNTYTPTLVTTYISKEHPSIQLNTTDINTAHQEHVIITL
ncbi:hypothetical protein HPB47_020032 [Ixodes persulcatus]|uniref:Uncharacterized protein n=1 Tax=Ixodes persulcatus TaxID=34615 RepID=A0AC60QII2_IXOPE|nr:hypothetical protein HPB47_020032 [Ixodes persulcatus]